MAVKAPEKNQRMCRKYTIPNDTTASILFPSMPKMKTFKTCVVKQCYHMCPDLRRCIDDVELERHLYYLTLQCPDVCDYYVVGSAGIS